MNFEFFMPDNITKRMNLRPAQKSDNPSDTNNTEAAGDQE